MFARISLKQHAQTLPNVLICACRLWPWLGTLYSLWVAHQGRSLLSTIALLLLPPPCALPLPPCCLIIVISPVPKAEKSGARKKRVESAEVLMGSPYKKMLFDKMYKTTEPKKKPRVQTSKSKKSNVVVPKRKKKLICRQDKPRGRPPKTLNIVDHRKTDQKQERRK